VVGFIIRVKRMAIKGANRGGYIHLKVAKNYRGGQHYEKEK